jgi:DNA repair protein RecN (Recombination protein N)
MLKNLIIKNYALLEELEMQPSDRLNIITGETGAGKSIMLGAIGLLLGNRADKTTLYNEDKKCIIEGVFTVNKFGLESIFDKEELDYDPLCILRREITPNGKSRAFVNDTPVRLETLRDIGGQLVDIHSQHDSLLLGDNSFQLQIIDVFANNQEQLQTYRKNYQLYRRIGSEYDRLEAEADRIQKEADFNNFLLEELLKAKLDSNEQALLEEELQVMENAGNIKEQLGIMTMLLSHPEQSVDNMMAEIRQALSKISGIAGKYDAMYQRIDSCMIELRDICREAELASDDVVVDFEKADSIRERLNLIYKLQKKHHVDSNAELLEIQARLEEKAEKAQNLDSELTTLKKAREAAYHQMIESAKALTASRKQVFNKVCNEIVRLLKNLGIPDASMEIVLRTVEPTDMGIDEINILFSANKGIAPQELRRVASGGEFSRLMFCIKYLMADKTSLPTIIFDEIDTGVSGEIAIKMVNMMKEMAKNHQVISISHLPQVAAKGDAHYFVYKDNSAAKAVSKIKKLTAEERVVEIAKMLGGDNPSEIAYQNAKELLN